MCEGFLDVHFQDFGNRFSLETDLQSFAVEAVPFADRAGDPDVGQKIHFQAVGAVSFAGLASPAFDVEAEPAGFVSPGLRFGQLGVEFADFVEDLDVRGRIAPRRASDGRLIDGNHAVEVFQALDSLV